MRGGEGEKKRTKLRKNKMIEAKRSHKKQKQKPEKCNYKASPVQG